MCLVLFAWHTRPDLPLVVAANRDEFYARPTEPLSRWDDGFVAGRDLLAGGTWMGIADSLRFAAVTNVRNGAPSTGARSRGALPVDYLRGRLSPADYAAQVAATGAEYGSFNLLVGDPAELWWATNRPHGRRQRVEPGVHGLSNAELATHLHISPGTAKAHVASLLSKLSARDRVHLVIAAYEAGLVSPSR